MILQCTSSPLVISILSNTTYFHFRYCPVKLIDTPALLDPVLLEGVSVVCHVLFGALARGVAEMQYTSRLVLSVYVAYKIDKHLNTSAMLHHK